MKLIVIFTIAFLTFSALAYNVNVDSGFVQKTVDGKCKCIMSLGKTQYKTLEPVIAKFEVINFDDKPLNIFSIFEENLDEALISITDNYGNIWDYNKSRGDYILLNTPSNVVQPFDTLVIGMRINNWGARIPIKDFSDYCFGLSGYFPPNRMYKVKLSFNDIISNEVEFEVADLDKEDSCVINLYKQAFHTWKYDTVVAIYPSNYFTEYIREDILGLKYSSLLNAANRNEDYMENFPDIISDFELFLHKYPYTYFVYDDTFMAQYYIGLYFKVGSYEELIKYLRRKNRNNNLYSFLSNRDIVNRMMNIVKIPE